MLASLPKSLGAIVLGIVFAWGYVIRHPLTPPASQSFKEKPPFSFEDVTARQGIDFKYVRPELDPLINGKRDMLYIGAGVAVADFDGDGWMDILLVNAGRGTKNALYLNQRGKGVDGFKDVAKEWGIADTNAEGANVTPVVFDFDNDGRPDVYLARMGCSMLFHNLGNRFENVTAKSGLGDCHNSVGAVPIDVDGDGKLDLYVLRNWRDLDYFHLPPEHGRIWTENFFNARNGGDNTLYRNRGDGTFEDVTRTLGGSDTGWAWDGGAADFEGDGHQQIYVANDYGPDTAFKVEGGKLVAQTNIRVFGMVDRRPGMGVSFGDVAHDGRPHIFITNQGVPYYSPGHGNFLWHYGPDGRAVDEAFPKNVHNCGGWAWGSAFGDFDLDGNEDLYVAAGMVTGWLGIDSPYHYQREYEFARRTGMTIPTVFADVDTWPNLGEQSLLGGSTDCVFWNRGDRFIDVASITGVTTVWDGRGAALVDFDNNGSLDLVVTTRRGPPHLLRNTVVPGRRWVELNLRGTRSNRDGAGARVELTQRGRPPQYRWATAGRSGFLASSDPRIHFGLPVEAPFDVTVRWPSGQLDRHEALQPGRLYDLVEGGKLP